MPHNTPVAPVPRKRGRPFKAAADASLDIRKAALVAFARAGFNGVSILEIAKLAGVAKPLVHYHYASKDALWEAAVGEAIGDLRAEILLSQQAFAASVSAQDLLRQLARQLVVFAARYPALVRIVVDETGKGGMRADWLRAHLLTPGYAMAKALLGGLASQRGLPGAAVPAAEHIVPIVLGVMNFPFMDAEVIRSSYGVDVYADAYIERHSALLFDIMEALLSKA